jgi:hypothetical protein
MCTLSTLNVLLLATRGREGHRRMGDRSPVQVGHRQRADRPSSGCGSYTIWVWFMAAMAMLLSASVSAGTAERPEEVVRFWDPKAEVPPVNGGAAMSASSAHDAAAAVPFKPNHAEIRRSTTIPLLPRLHLVGDGMRSVVPSNDGTWILTVGQDRTRLWDARMGCIALEFEQASYAQFSRDSRYLLIDSQIVELTYPFRSQTSAAFRQSPLAKEYDELVNPRRFPMVRYAAAGPDGPVERYLRSDYRIVDATVYAIAFTRVCFAAIEGMGPYWYAIALVDLAANRAIGGIARLGNDVTRTDLEALCDQSGLPQDARTALLASPVARSLPQFVGGQRSWLSDDGGVYTTVSPRGFEVFTASGQCLWRVVTARAASRVTRDVVSTSKGEAIVQVEVQESDSRSILTRWDLESLAVHSLTLQGSWKISRGLLEGGTAKGPRVLAHPVTGTPLPGTDGYSQWRTVQWPLIAGIQRNRNDGNSISYALRVLDVDTGWLADAIVPAGEYAPERALLVPDPQRQHILVVTAKGSLLIDLLSPTLSAWRSIPDGLMGPDYEPRLLTCSWPDVVIATPGRIVNIDAVTGIVAFRCSADVVRAQRPDNATSTPDVCIIAHMPCGTLYESRTTDRQQRSYSRTVLLDNGSRSSPLWNIIDQTAPYGFRQLQRQRFALCLSDRIVICNAPTGALCTLWPLSNGELFAQSDDGSISSNRQLFNAVTLVDMYGRYAPASTIDIVINRPDLVLQKLGSLNTRHIDLMRTAWMRRVERLGMDPARMQMEQAYGRDVPKIRLKAPVPSRIQGSVLDLECRIWGMEAIPLTLSARNGSQSPIKAGVPVGPMGVTRQARLDGIPLVVGTNRIDVSGRTPDGRMTLPIRTNVFRSGNLGVTYAVVIGVSDFQDGRLNLDYAAADADAIASMLERAGARVLRCINAGAGLDCATRMASFLGQAGVDDQAVVFVATHGFIDAQMVYRIALHETDVARLDTTTLPMKRLLDVLGDSKPRRQAILLDTCQAGELHPAEMDAAVFANRTGVRPPGTMVRGLRRTQDQPVVRPPITPKPAADPMESSRDRDPSPSRDMLPSQLAKMLFEDLAFDQGVTVIAASRGNEFSFESSAWQHGAFTRAILDSATDQQADVNNNGRVDLEELTSYISRRVPALTGESQHPEVRSGVPDADWTLWSTR